VKNVDDLSLVQSTENYIRPTVIESCFSQNKRKWNTYPCYNITWTPFSMMRQIYVSRNASRNKKYETLARTELPSLTGAVVTHSPLTAAIRFRYQRRYVRSSCGHQVGQVDFAQVLWFPPRTDWFRSSTLVSSQYMLISLKYSGFLPGQIDFAQVLWFPHRTGWFRSSTLVSSLDRLISLKYSGFLPGQVDFAQVLWFPHRLISGFLQLKDQINISTDDSDFYSLYNLFRYRCKLNKV